MKITIIMIMIAIAGSISISATSVYGSEQSPYDSGYDHGCDDAGLSPSDRYINEEGKGPSHHTNAFMNGYNSGYDSCSGESSGFGSNSRGDGGDDTAHRLCNLIDDNRLAATALAIAIGFPGLDQAASALCVVTGN
jgi:hypothetical protein